MKKKLSLFVSLLSSLVFALSPAAVVKETPRKWQDKMKALAAVMGELLPELASRNGSRTVIEKNAKALSLLAHEVKKGAMAKNTSSPPSDFDPSITMIAGRFADDARSAYRAIHGGNIDYGKSVLRSVTSYCIACHTRHDGGPDFPVFPLDPKTSHLDRLGKAELFAATRQFDRALITFREILADDKVAQTEQLAWQQAMRHALAISVRVKHDPEATGDIVMHVITQPATPEFTKKQALKWRESVEQWKKEPALKTQGEEALYGEAKRLVKEARASQEYPVDHSGDILYLRASAVAHELLSRAPDGPHAADAIYIAGLSYEVLNDPVLWPLHEVYFEACVRKSPHTSLAEECYQHYEQAIFFGYSGSAGVFIPDDIQATMKELNAMAKVDRMGQK